MYINTTLWFSSCNKVRAAVREDESTRSRTLDSFLTAPSVWCVSLSLSRSGLGPRHAARWSLDSAAEEEQRTSGWRAGLWILSLRFTPRLSPYSLFLSLCPSFTHSVGSCEAVRTASWRIVGNERRWQEGCLERERERAWCRMKVFQLTGSVSDLWPEVYSLSLDAVSRSFSLPLSFVAVFLLTSSCFFIQLSSCLSLACTLLHSFTPTQNF